MESPGILRRGISVARILIGIAALVVGVKNLLDPGFLYGSLYFRLSEFGTPYTFYQRVLTRFEFQQTLLAYCVCASQILLGLSYLTGAVVSLASLGAAFLVLNFALATSAGSVGWLILLLLCAAIFLAMGYAGAGLHWGVDGWLVERINEKVILFPLRFRLPKW
jgi:hypothetical protein